MALEGDKNWGKSMKTGRKSDEILSLYDTVSRSEKFAIQRGQKIHHQNSLKLYINMVRHDLGIIKKKWLMQNCDFFDS